MGLGNDNHTADSVGPKVLKYIKVNGYLKNFNYKKQLVSALEPGVMGETGIVTERIIASVSKEIKPDIIIVIDSFVTNNINYLNKSIEITDLGLDIGSGIKKINSKIDKETLGIPIMAIGVPTAVEVNFKDDKLNYLLSSKEIDDYVIKIARIIGNCLNEVIGSLEMYQDSNDIKYRNKNNHS